MKTTSAIIIGVCIMAAAVVHAALCRTGATASEPGYTVERPTPIKTGYVQGQIWKRESDGVAHLKCHGFKVECYDSIVIVYVDRQKEPTWSANIVLTIPWDKIEYLTLMPE